MATDKKPTITPEFRVSFPSVFKPVVDDQGNEVYSVTMLWLKNQDMTWLKKLIDEAVAAKWPNLATRPKNLTLPLRDGEEKSHLDGYMGHWFATARKRKLAPNVVDSQRQPILSEGEFYAGCFAVASIDVYAYDNPKKKGVSIGLYNIMKTRDGEPFAASNRPAESDFPADFKPSASVDPLS